MLNFKSGHQPTNATLRDLIFEIRAPSLLAVDALGAGRNADYLPRGGDVAVASADDDAGHYAAFGVGRGAEERLVLGCHELADLVGEGVTLCNLLGTDLRWRKVLVKLLVVKMMDLKNRKTENENTEPFPVCSSCLRSWDRSQPCEGEQGGPLMR